MTDTSKIYDDFLEVDPNEKFEVIKFYEKNSLILDNRSNFRGSDDFEEYISILVQYTISLENTGKYSKAIEYAEKVIDLIDSKAEEFHINLSDYIPYWRTLTIKGRAYYNLKQYKYAIETFNRLLSQDPENDNLKEWLNASKSEKRKSINKYLYISSLLLFLFSFMVESRNIGRLFGELGFIFLIFASVNEYFGDRIVNWMKKS